MNALILARSLKLLVQLDWMIHEGALESIHTLVRRCEVNARHSTERPQVETICRAVDLSCVFYLRPVLCLQRSAVTTVLLRRHGWPAQMVIGAQVLPFKSHAWVELDGVVINDKPYVRERYLALERC
jgi:hypothetical protein